MQSTLLVALLLAVVGPLLGEGTAMSDPGARQRGFALIWDGGYTGPQIADSLREMRDAGATWVQFTPAWSQPDKASSTIDRNALTIPDLRLEEAISAAHAAGLKVHLSPHLYLPFPESRSTIQPADPASWFAGYTRFIGHYADIAQKTGVDQFAVGSELASVSDDRERWLEVIRDVRARYSGPLTYGAEPGEYDRVPFWDALDLIGIDVYWSLGSVPTTDVEQLRRAWEPVRAELSAFAASQGRKIVFTEAGFTSQRGTSTQPADWMVSNTPDQAEQAAGYESLLAVFSNEDWWQGVYWWVWNALPDHGGDHATSYSPRGKLAETVIRERWR